MLLLMFFNHERIEWLYVIVNERIEWLYVIVNESIEWLFTK